MTTNATTAPTCLVGLIGRNIGGSKSPALHEHEADALGIRCLYRLLDLAVLKCDVEALPQLLRSAELMGFAGLNITHPCKQAVIPLLDELSEEARAIGAVNTVQFDRGRRVGYNTDAAGFGESFRRGLPGVPMDRVVQLGAGGAGAATAYAMLRHGVGRLQIVDSAPGRAAALAASLAHFFPAARVSAEQDVVAALGSAQGLINATPTGMREHPGMPVTAAALRSDLWVAEIVYFPLETALLRAARALGCRTLDGGGMAVFQAAAAFEIFTGRPADRERMLAHFKTLPGD